MMSACLSENLKGRFVRQKTGIYFMFLCTAIEAKQKTNEAYLQRSTKHVLPFLSECWTSLSILSIQLLSLSRDRLERCSRASTRGVRWLSRNAYFLRSIHASSGSMSYSKHSPAERARNLKTLSCLLTSYPWMVRRWSLYFTGFVKIQTLFKCVWVTM